jgi:hypothetical protein
MRLFPEDEGQRAKESEHGKFQYGLNGGWFDHGGD